MILFSFFLINLTLFCQNALVFPRGGIHFRNQNVKQSKKSFQTSRINIINAVENNKIANSENVHAKSEKYSVFSMFDGNSVIPKFLKTSSRKPSTSNDNPKYPGTKMHKVVHERSLDELQLMLSALISCESESFLNEAVQLFQTMQNTWLIANKITNKAFRIQPGMLLSDNDVILRGGGGGDNRSPFLTSHVSGIIDGILRISSKRTNSKYSSKYTTTSDDIFTELQYWRDMLLDRQVVTPDAMAYAILLRMHLFLLSANNTQSSAISDLLRHMSSDGVDLERHVFPLAYLTNEEVEAIREEVRSVCPSAVTGERHKDNKTAKLTDKLDSFLNEFIESLDSNKFISFSSSTTFEHQITDTNRNKQRDSGRNRNSFSLLDGITPDSNLHDLQRQLETDCGVGGAGHHQLLTERTAHLASRIKDAVKQKNRKHFLTIVGRKSDSHDASLLLFSSLLGGLSPEIVAQVVLRELLRINKLQRVELTGTGGISSSTSQETFGYHMVFLAQAIGDSLEKEVYLQQLRSRPWLNQSEPLVREGRATELSPSTADVRLARSLTRLHRAGEEGRLNARAMASMDPSIRQMWAQQEVTQAALQADWIPRWSPSTKVELGSFALGVGIDNLWLRLNNDSELSAVVQSKSRKLDSSVQSAFQHTLTVSDEGESVGYVVISPAFHKALSSNNTSIQTSDDRLKLPMLVPPRAWLTASSGGYLTHSANFIRIKHNPIHKAVIASADRQHQLDRVLTTLDVLGRVKWQVNEPVLTVAERLWSEGVKICNDNLTEAVHLSSLLKSLTAKEVKQRVLSRRDFTTQSAHEEYKLDCAEKKEDSAKEQRTHSTTSYRLDIARQFTKASKGFYFPHSMDFRGRAYPIPPHFSHQGNDLCRGLLLFKDAKPLGEQGLEWLFVHLANTAGGSKLSMKERRAFTLSHRSEIEASASDPLGDHATTESERLACRWWMTVEDPWQCLAACKELAAVWAAPQPEKFLSALPVQLDGTCNGLQHFAALGRDVKGSRQVNLSPSHRPQDVYNEVVRLVEKRLRADVNNIVSSNRTKESVVSLMSDAWKAVPAWLRRSSNDSSEVLSTPQMAAMLVGKIRRKVVKQTVMTSVLGGTRHGAKDKVARRLKEFSILPEALSGKQRQQVAAYLVDLIFDSQAGLFQGAQLIQKWLHGSTTEVGQAVSPANAPLVQRAMNNKVKESSVTRAIRFLVRSVTGTEYLPRSGDVADSRAVYPQTSLQWTTLLGLPVMLPYRKTKLTRVHTALQDVHLNLTSPLDRVDVGKQANSMAPNFIHSLDSTHMLMTAEACAENDIDFAAVHDCFWTHAGRVDDMNTLLRQSFVDLHSQPILERLRAEFIARYQDYVVPLWSSDEKQLRDDGHHQFHRHRDPSRRRIVGWRPVRIQPLPQVGAFNISEVVRAKYFFC